MTPKIWNDLFLGYDSGKEVLQGILDSYASLDRYYHNTQHLVEMTGVLTRHVAKLQTPQNVIFACLYHDVVYDTQATDNEEKSAARARNDLARLGLATTDIDFIADLILSTKKHAPIREAFDGLLFLDADLAILGSDAGRYGEYMDAIRREYSWVGEKEYRVERTRILKKFLDRERIYFTDEIYAAHEKAARENLRHEIEALEK